MRISGTFRRSSYVARRRAVLMGATIAWLLHTKKLINEDVSGQTRIGLIAFPIYYPLPLTRPSRWSQAIVCPTTSENFIPCSLFVESISLYVCVLPLLYKENAATFL